MIDFSNTIILATTNLGAQYLLKDFEAQGMYCSHPFPGIHIFVNHVSITLLQRHQSANAYVSLEAQMTRMAVLRHPFQRVMSICRLQAAFKEVGGVLC